MCLYDVHVHPSTVGFDESYQRRSERVILTTKSSVGPDGEIVTDSAVLEALKADDADEEQALAPADIDDDDADQLSEAGGGPKRRRQTV
jgi:hypothetical protein